MEYVSFGPGIDPAEQVYTISLNPQFETCLNLFSQEQQPILGQFKARKSFFLNGLLGPAILPVGALLKSWISQVLTVRRGLARVCINYQITSFS